ncbi:hypothetical protein BDW69DRAFT_95270 [Aspergillus filifer]
MRETESLQSQLSQSKDRESETSQELKTTKKKLKDAYNEQGRLETKLEQAERNLNQEKDDHCKLEKLELRMEQQEERIEQLEREVEEHKGVIEAKKKENLDQQVKLKTKDRQLEDAQNAVSLAEKEKDALRAGAERLSSEHAKVLAQAQAMFRKKRTNETSGRTALRNSKMIRKNLNKW